MKKNLLFIIGFIYSILGVLLCDTKALALTLLKEPQPNVYTYRHGGSSHAFSGAFTYYSVGGKTTYCIEPGVDIIKDALLKGNEGFTSSPYLDEINEKIQLIGYYGFDYPGHQTLKYRMATQALIWETVGDQTVEFWTEKSGAGKIYNIKTEKDTINALVNEHYILPSFASENKKVVLGSSVTFTDNLGVLAKFKVSDKDQDIAEIKGNELIVTPKEAGAKTITLEKETYTKSPTTLFVGIDQTTQIMAYFGYYNPIKVSVNVQTLGITLTLNKLDNVTKTNTAKGDCSLKGAVYGVYKGKDKIGEIITDASGKGTIQIPQLGDYTVKEITPSKGYLLDGKSYSIKITEDNLNPELTVYEAPIYKNIKVTKYLGDRKTGTITPEANIKFDFYLKSNMHFYTSQTTNASGYITVNLPYGTYIVRQVNVTSGYEKVADFEVTIDENSKDLIPIVITNMKEQKEAYLKVNKIDEDTKQVIPLDGVKFKIKNRQTNEYVCQKVTYPNEEEICEYIVKNGTFTTPLPLEYGEYSLEEVDDAISGYLWNSQALAFSINENSSFSYNQDNDKIMEINFANKRVKGEITVHKWGEIFKSTNNELSYDKQLLDNVTYELYALEDIYNEMGEVIHSKDDLIGTYTTKDGTFKVTNLELGSYYLKEKKTQKGYLLDEEKHCFTLKYQDQYTPIVKIDIELDNALIKGNLILQKIDAFKKKGLANAVIEIYNAQKELIYTAKTDEDGIIKIANLPYGKYYLREKEAPLGYLINTQEMEFSIKKDKEEITLTLEDNPIVGTVLFTKIDSLSKDALANSIIGLYNENDELLFEGTTDELGQIKWENVYYGKYYILEISAPEGYLKSEEKQEFTITKENQIINITLENTPIIGHLKITKTNQFDMPLKGVLIELYNEKDELIEECYTSDTGEITFTNLKYGNYYLLEKETLEGYIINKEKIPFSIQNNNEIKEIKMVNNLITGSVEFTKMDYDDKTKLANALIEIYNSQDELIFSGKTNEDGIITVNDLVYGDYYLLEKEAPNGYELDDRKINFTIKEDKALVKISMANKKITEPPINFKVPKTSWNINYIFYLGGFIALGLLKYLRYEKKK